jgi:hypothetical protein
MLKCFVDDFKGEWDEWLPKVCFAYNTSIHATTDETPFKALYGRTARIPMDIMFDTVTQPNYEGLDEYVLETREKLRRIYDRMGESAKTAVDRGKINYNRRAKCEEYEVGEWVYLLDFKTEKEPKKLNRIWKGPYQITSKTSQLNYEIKKNGKGKGKIVHVNRLKRCFRQVNKDEESFEVGEEIYHVIKEVKSRKLKIWDGPKRIVIENELEEYVVEDKSGSRMTLKKESMKKKITLDENNRMAAPEERTDNEKQQKEISKELGKSNEQPRRSERIKLKSKEIESSSRREKGRGRGTKQSDNNIGESEDDEDRESESKQ